MHPSVMDWVGDKVAEHELQYKNVLEVGSRNVNGSVRRFFGGLYLGVDMVPGEGVDMVARADQLPFDPNRFEVVVSTEMLEHDPYFWLSLPEMARVLMPGGYLLLTTRGIGFHYHEYPGDYWRFTEDAIRHLLSFADLQELEIVPDPYDGHPGWFALARKDEQGREAIRRNDGGEMAPAGEAGGDRGGQ
jgi:SAM-dependent methyltransferase